ncbi:hypothetical protein ACGFNU_36965 [Spirillospora sp. NPDC048911]|uniref:hypothetical protein n=1 Tax=Spirillospora sp. NPDC048911 TaxID=3364527 RepID=UPI0037104DCB
MPGWAALRFQNMNEPGEDAGSGSGREVRRGDVPFAVLTDKSVIMAEFRTTLESQGPGWDDAEVTWWTLTYNGRPFQVVAENEKDAWLPIGEQWADGGRRPLKARPYGAWEAVSYHHYYAHHFGSVSGDVTLAFDICAMTVGVMANLKVDLD